MMNDDTEDGIDSWVQADKDDLDGIEKGRRRKRDQYLNMLDSVYSKK